MAPLVPAPASPSPPALNERAEQLSCGLNPVVLAWIDKEAREAAADPRIDVFRLRQSVARRFSARGADLSGEESEAVLFLMLKAAAAASDSAFRETLKGIWALKEELRITQEELAFFHETRALLRDPPPERVHLRVVPPVSEEHMLELEEAAATAAAKLPAMSEQRNRMLSTLYSLLNRPTPSRAKLRALR